MRKSKEIISGALLNQYQPKFAAKAESVANGMLCLIQFESYVDTCIDWMSFNFRFKDFWAICYSTVLLNNHPWVDPKDLSYISSSQFSHFWSWWFAQWALTKNCIVRKYFDSNLCPMLYWEKWLSRIRVYLVWPWYSTCAIRGWQSCMQKICSRLRYDRILLWRVIQFFFKRAMWTHGLVVKASLSRSGDKLSGSEPVSALTRAPLYWCTVSISSSSWVS